MRGLKRKHTNQEKRGELNANVAKHMNVKWRARWGERERPLVSLSVIYDEERETLYLLKCLTVASIFCSHDAHAGQMDQDAPGGSVKRAGIWIHGTNSKLAPVRES